MIKLTQINEIKNLFNEVFIEAIGPNAPIIEKEIDEKLEYPLCIKAKSGAYPEDCGGIYGYEEYYSNDEREEINK